MPPRTEVEHDLARLARQGGRIAAPERSQTASSGNTPVSLSPYKFPVMGSNLPSVRTVPVPQQDRRSCFCA